MKKCSFCNQELLDDAVICPMCQGIVATRRPAPSESVTQAPINPVHAPVHDNSQHTFETVHLPEVVTTGEWLWKQLLVYIPFVGSLIYIIMLIIWMNDRKHEDSFKNWAVAQLVVTSIVFVLSIVAVVALFSLRYKLPIQ